MRGSPTGWRRQALSGGSSGERADRDLDAVLALFDAAGAFVDRLPTAGPDKFLEHIQGQDVPGDTLLVGGQSGGRVALLTPQTAAGRQWRIVVVAGVQEGVWPDLRLRGSVLGSEDLVDVVAQRPLGFRAAQAAVRYDETRLFLVAVTRATERLLVTAVGNEDEQPSVYLDLVDPPATTRLADEVRPHSEVARTMTLPGLVGELRREAVSPDPGVAEPALNLLAAAAREGVRGADPTLVVGAAVGHERATRAPARRARARVAVEGDLLRRVRAALVPHVGRRRGRLPRRRLGRHVRPRHRRRAARRAARRAEARGRRALGPPRAQARLGHRPHAPGGARHGGPVRGLPRRRPSATGSASASRPTSGSRSDAPSWPGASTASSATPRGACASSTSRPASPSRRGPSSPQHGQLGAYQVAVEEGGFPALGERSAGAALVFIGKGGLSGLKPSVLPQPPLASSDDPTWARALVEETAEGMGAGEFRAAQGKACETCPVRSSCPVQPEGDAL